MSEEILINVTPQETRVAVVENGMLQEVHIERAGHRGIVGNIYKGKVARVLPGMQAAFVDIGLDRAAFLHASDVHPLPVMAEVNGNGDGNDDGAGTEVVTRHENRAPPPAIQTLLHEGQEIVVQVDKDPLGTKGARLTMQLTLPGRYLVYMPHSRHIGISQKITDENTRARLRTFMQSMAGENEEGGFILRTLSEAATEDELEADIRYLRRTWQACRERIAMATAGLLIHEDLPLAMRAMRDLVRANVEKIRIDSRETFLKARDFAIHFIPEIAERVEYYPGERPIFDLYSVEDEIQRRSPPRCCSSPAGTWSSTRPKP